MQNIVDQVKGAVLFSDGTLWVDPDTFLPVVDRNAEDILLLPLTTAIRLRLELMFFPEFKRLRIAPFTLN